MNKLLIFVLLLTLIGCGQVSDDFTPKGEDKLGTTDQDQVLTETKSEVSEKKVELPTKKAGNPIDKKLVDASRLRSGVHIETEYSIRNGEGNASGYSETKYAKDDHRYWHESDGGFETNEEYIVDGKRYYKKDVFQDWSKSDFDDAGFENIEKSFKVEDLTRKILINPELFEVDETEKEFIFSFESGDDQAIKDMGFTNFIFPSVDEGAEVTFAKFEVLYIVDKFSYKPISLYYFIDKEIKGPGYEDQVVQSQTQRFLSFNEPVEIVLPEEALKLKKQEH